MLYYLGLLQSGIVKFFLQKSGYTTIPENKDPSELPPIIIQLEDADSANDRNGCPCSLDFDTRASQDIIENFAIKPLGE